MENSKLISLKDAIRAAFKKLFENANLGFVFKSYLTLAALVSIIAIPVMIVYGVSMFAMMPKLQEQAQGVQMQQQSLLELQGQLEEMKDLQAQMEDMTPQQRAQTAQELKQRYEQMQEARTQMEEQTEVTPESAEPNPLENFSGPLAIALGAVIAILIIIVAAIAGTFTILIPVKIHQGELVSMKELLKISARKAPRFFGLIFLTGIVIALGFILLVIPGIIFMIWFLFSPYILLSEDIGIFEALKKSKKITKGYRWNLFLKGVGFSLLMMIGLIVLMPFLYLANALAMPLWGTFTPLVLLQVFKDLQSKTDASFERGPKTPEGKNEEDREDEDKESGEILEEAPPVGAMQEKTEDATPINIPDELPEDEAKLD